MFERFSIELPFRPKAKERPRFSRRSGRVYTPSGTLEFEGIIREKILKKMADQGIDLPINQPIRVETVFEFQVPDSYSNKKKKSALNGEIPYIKRPDIDNLQKAIFDSMNKHILKDDCLIVESESKKKYSKNHSKILITIVIL